MNVKSKILIFLVFTTVNLIAQKFVEGAHRFSDGKISYLYLEDGTIVKGYIDDLDRKKGLIEEVVLKDSITKKKVTYKPEQIKNMYLPPSGFDKFTKGYDKIYDVQKWEDDNVNAQFIKEGYVLFEKSDVMIKKKKFTLLLQLVNPGFSEKVRVYLDPNASETTSYGVGGFTLAGGDAKSYYVKKGNEVAFKLQKKNYEEEYKHLFGDCAKYYDANLKKFDWEDLAKNIYDFSKESK